MKIVLIILCPIAVTLGCQILFTSFIAPIFKYDNRYFCQSTLRGFRNYALWQPVKKFLFFYLPWGQKFWLDLYGFEPVNWAAKRQLKRIAKGYED
jgi:hypothetical protein